MCVDTSTTTITLKGTTPRFKTKGKKDSRIKSQILKNDYIANALFYNGDHYKITHKRKHD